jgi:hypothetical protein
MFEYIGKMSINMWNVRYICWILEVISFGPATFHLIKWPLSCGDVVADHIS